MNRRGRCAGVGAAWWMGLGAVLGCPTTTGTPPPVEIVPAGCNPLGLGTDCLLPYPSDHFLVDDATLPTGRRVAIPEAAQLRQDNGLPVDFFLVHASDGFSHLPALVALFPGAVSQANLHTYDKDLSASIGSDATTVVVDTVTGNKILHVSELDPHGTAGQDQALIIRPLVRLENRRRYVVGIRRLVTPAGAAVNPPDGFRRARDGDVGTSPALINARARLEADVFPVLAQAGFARGDLQLAWDFTTGSIENVTSDMLRARELLVAALDANPPTVTVRSVVDSATGPIARQVEGTMVVPNFMEAEEPGSYLFRGADGQVAINGTSNVSFTVLVPRGVMENASARPARVVNYGHGFFGERSEMLGSFFTNYLEATGTVGIGVDWWGMSLTDVGVVLDDLLNNMPETMRFTDRITQGMMNRVALEYVVRHRLAGLAELQVSGQPVVEPTQQFYYGNSQGHILGGVFMALTRYTDRGVLGVGGMGFFSLIAMRARPFIQYLSTIENNITLPLEHQKLLALGQSTFDRVDPGTYVPLVRTSSLPGAPTTRHILMQIGMGDTQVPIMAGEAHARSLGLVLMTPSPQAVAEMATSAGPVDDSALEEFDFGIPAPRPGTFPEFPEGENGVHEGVRRSVNGRAQADGFLRPNGTIVHTCDGPCDPE